MLLQGDDAVRPPLVTRLRIDLHVHVRQVDGHRVTEIQVKAVSS